MKKALTYQAQRWNEQHSKMLHKSDLMSNINPEKINSSFLQKNKALLKYNKRYFVLHNKNYFNSIIHILT